MIIKRNKQFSWFSNLFKKKSPSTQPKTRKKLDPFHMEIEDVFSIMGKGTVVTGKIKRGSVEVGDEVKLEGKNISETVVVNGIEKFRKVLNKASVGENVGINLRGIDHRKIQRGDILCNISIEDLLKTKPESHLYVSEKEKADIKKISPQHRILMEIFDKVEKSRPTWEFLEEVGPQFSFIDSIDIEDEEIELKLDNQSGNIYRWTGKYWEEINNSRPPRKIQNLKQELLKELSEYRKEWDKEDEDTGRSIVLNYIDHLEQEIKKSRL